MPTFHKVYYFLSIDMQNQALKTILAGYTFKSHLDSESWNCMTLDLIYYNDCCYEQRILNTILNKSCWMQQLGGLNMYWINAHHHVNSENFKNQNQSQSFQKYSLPGHLNYISHLVKSSLLIFEEDTTGY